MRNCFVLILLLQSSETKGQKLPECVDTGNFVRIGENKFLARYEVTVKEYLDYLDSVERDSSIAFYNSQLPDSAALEYLIYANTYYKCPGYPVYYENYGFHRFPAIAVGFEQAVNFCMWRTSQLKIINKECKVKFRLPDPSEWQEAAEVSGELVISENYKLFHDKYFPDEILDSLKIERKRKRIYRTDFNVRDIAMVIYKDSIYKYLKKPWDGYTPRSQPVEVYNSVRNHKGFFHLDDNVSEMTSVRGIAKGRNYQLDHKEDSCSGEIKYFHPQPWLGFRMLIEIAE